MLAAIFGASYCGANECRASDLHAWLFGDADKTMNVMTFILVVIALWQIMEARVSGQQQALDTIEALRVSRDAANAAKKSADASVEAQRARFHIVLAGHNFTDFTPNLAMNPGAPGENPIFNIEVHYAFKNYGKTPAIVFELSHGLVVSPTLPETRLYDHREHTLERMVIGEGETTESQFFDGEPMTFGQARLLAGGAAFVWFYAKIAYRDVFGVNHTDAFMYRYPGVGLREPPPYLCEFVST